MPRRRLVSALIIPALLTILLLPASAQELPGMRRKVVKTDAQWRKLLTRAQYEVTRNKATEPPFSGKYAVSHAHGIYTCVCCSSPLFSSQAKFDSGTGWPSFWQPINPRYIDGAPDYEAGEARVEVVCHDCGAHLGHVFNDGPPPTGLRFCINSLSLKFLPALSNATTSKKGSSKTKKGATPPPESGSQEPAQDDAKPPVEGKEKEKEKAETSKETGKS